MANALLLVHGMGEHKPGWSADIVTKLDQMAAQYPAFQNGASSFTSRLSVHEVCYDNVFSSYVDAWNKDASKLDDWAKGRGQELPKVVSWLKTSMPGDATNFFWTTAIDPLLYRGFHLVRDDVRAQVCDQLATVFTDVQKSGATSITILAHSLGTAVMHDSLEMMARGYKGNMALSAARWGVNNIVMLADVCLLARKLVADIDYLNSSVRPRSAGAAGTTYCDFFMNAWHEFDPFARLAPFRPNTWGRGYFPVGPLQHFHNANVHGYTHYLDHPLVHVPLINASLGRNPDGSNVITSEQQQGVLGTYPQTPSKGCDQEIADVKAKAIAVAQATDLEETVIAIAEFLAATKRAAGSCKSLYSADMFK